MSSPGRLRLPLALLALGVAGVVAASDPPATESSEGLVYSVTLNDALHPVTARYLKEAIQKANEARARLLILKLDTPGGLVSSVEEMVKDITSSRVPIVVFVNGSKAASGRFFLTVAADVAVHEPGTRIGAAHPILIPTIPTGGGYPEDPPHLVKYGNGRPPRAP